MKTTILTLASTSLLWLIISAKAEDILVSVEEGILRGTTAMSVYNTSYTTFLGIPYAEPPVGDLRFKAPQAASGWEGTRDATQYGSDCLLDGGSVGSEDCLYLNVFVPGVPREGADLPVLFWVHGGGFVFGSGSDQEHGPDFLISYGVILVTISYRLGPFGFLSTADEAAPGNVGLKDLQLALSWVQRNIARFGGDPQVVAMQGQSAGGVAVSLHLVSPESAGLFSRLIDESGRFVASLSVVREPRYHAFRLGSVLGYQAEDSRQLIEFLRSVNASELLVDTSLLMTDEELLYFSSSVWSPSIEPDLDGAFITESPIVSLNEGRFHHVPIMIGVTSAEGGSSVLSEPNVISNLNEQFENVIGPCLHLSTAEQQTEAALKLRDFYFSNKTISADNPDPLFELSIDISFFEATDLLVRRVTELTNLSVYYYEFDYRGENVPGNQWGVSHSAELPFLFLRMDTEYNFDPQSEEDQVRRNVLRLWTNFTKYGNPTPEADPVIWEPYDLTNRSFLLMQANFSLAHNKNGERMDFWNENAPLLPYPGTH